MSATGFAPRATTWSKDVSVGLQERGLLRWSKLNHSQVTVSCIECCKDFAAESEIWMANVFSLLGSRKRHGDFCKLSRRHDCSSLLPKPSEISFQPVGIKRGRLEAYPTFNKILTQSVR